MQYRPSVVMSTAAAGSVIGMEVRTQQSGRLEDVSPLDLLQSLHIYRRAGHVVFVHPHGRSRLWFEAGEIVDAESGALRGAAAVYRIATYERGEFRVEVTGEARARTIERSGSAMIFEAAYRIDEGKRLRAELPAVEAVLLRPPTAIPIQGPTEEHRRVVAMLEVGATLGEVLECSGLGELETLQWMAELVKAGQLGPTGAVRSPAPPAGDGLGGPPPGWPVGLEPSQPFVPLPSYAEHGGGFDEAPALRRRWWIHASIGAAVAAIVTFAIVRGGSDPSNAASLAAGGGSVTVIDATKAVGPPIEVALRERPLAVGAAASMQPSAPIEQAEPATSRARSSGKRKAARQADRAASEKAEARPTVQPEPRAEAADEPEDASSLLVEARRAYAAGQGATAYRLASRSQQLRPSDGAAELMTLAACQQQHPEAAAEALRAVPLLRRGSVRSTCKQAHGVRVKVSRGSR
jgi:hypothetical protein